MECVGVQIDQEFCKKETKKGEFRKLEILEELNFLKPTSGKDLEVLLLQKLKLPVLHRTPSGRPSFNKQAMKDYDAILSRSNNPTAQRVLEYRGWDKTVSSNYRAYLNLVGKDGRLRCNYKLTGTKTSRTSCEKPNLQQIPKASDKPWNGKLKDGFIPEQGYGLWGFDYSNLELRVIAGYCGEPRLVEVFEKGLNVFDVMEKDLGFPRDLVKTFYYATGYGAQDPKIALTLGIPVASAAKLRKTFYSTYAKMGAFKERVKSAAGKNLRIKLWTGRVRHFRNRREAEHLSFNSLIQGAGAELVKNRMIALSKVIDWDTCRMLLLVHDELIFEIKEGMESHWHPIIKEVMEDVPEPLGKFVKFTVDCKKWGEK
jgi:DNA polymerase-1